MTPRKSQTKSRPSQKRSKKKSKKPEPRLQGKCFESYEIPRSKIERAMEYLEANAKTNDTTHRRGGHHACFGSIVAKISPTRKVDNYLNDTVNVLKVARHCALRGRWPELMETVAILMEDIRHYDMQATLRNAFYAIIADPTLNDPSFLEAYLYSNPRCTNAGDVSYCIDKILEVFQGVTIIPSVRRNDKVGDAPDRSSASNESSMESSDNDGDESSEQHSE